MNGFVFDTLTIERVDPSPDRVELRFGGEALNSDMDASLASFLQHQVGEAKQRGCALDLYFAKIEACRSGFVHHIAKLVGTAIDQQVRVRLHFDPSRRWQQRQMAAMTLAWKSHANIELLVGTSEASRES